MDAQDERPPNEEHGDQAELNDFGKVAFHFLKFGQNATNNMSKTFGDMTLEQWIRIVIIVGAYLLLRPHIMTFLGKKHVDKMVKEDNKAKAEISPNQLRGAKSHPMLGDEDDEDDDEDDEDLGQGTGANWGSKARTRQRVMLKKLMEAEQRRKEEEDSDEDIADLLID